MLSTSIKARSAHAALGSIKAEGYKPSASAIRQNNAIRFNTGFKGGVFSV